MSKNNRSGPFDSRARNLADAIAILKRSVSAPGLDRHYFGAQDPDCEFDDLLKVMLKSIEAPKKLRSKLLKLPGSVSD